MPREAEVAVSIDASADGCSTTSSTVPDREAVRSLAEAPTESGTVVWHREDLRIADNPALATAATYSDRILPLFVSDPTFYSDRGTACDARIAFLHDCLRDLDRQSRDVGAPGLTYAHGDPIEVLGRFVDAGGDAVATRSVTGRDGLRRDDRRRASTRSTDRSVRHRRRLIDEPAWERIYVCVPYCGV